MARKRRSDPDGPWLQSHKDERAWLTKAVTQARPKGCPLRVRGKVPHRGHMVHVSMNGDHFAIGRGSNDETAAYRADTKGRVRKFLPVADSRGTDAEAVGFVVRDLCRGGLRKWGK